MSLAVPNQTHDRTQEPASGHAHVHGHSHGHAHDHGHDHAPGDGAHAHGPRRASPGLSLLRMSSLQRLAIALAFVAAIWLGVFWAWA